MNEVLRLKIHYTAVRKRLHSGPYRENFDRAARQPVMDPGADFELSDLDWMTKGQVMLIDAVAREHGLLRRDLIGPSQVKLHFEARNDLVWRLHVELGMGYEGISDLLGRERSNVQKVLKRRRDALAMAPA